MHSMARLTAVLMLGALVATPLAVSAPAGDGAGATAAKKCKKKRKGKKCKKKPAPAPPTTPLTPPGDVLPTAVNDSPTITEDAAATAIDVLANDTDPDGGTKLVQSASDPANGTVAITGGGTGLTYDSDPNYCNTQTGGSADTFTYTLNGGSTATVSVTVTCVSDGNPIANNDTAMTLQDTPLVLAYADVTGNDADPDPEQSLTVILVQNASNGVVQITGGNTITFTPNSGFQGVASFEYTVADPDGHTDIGQVFITVTT
jgi:hypothetical protein